MSFNFQTMAKRNPSDFMATSRIPIRGAEVKEGFSRIPMFVADMSFECAPSITEALMQRIQTPAYGYFPMQDAYYDAILNWQTTHNHYEGLTRDMIGYENGVLGGVTSALKALCPQGGKVLVHTPVYVGFTGTLRKCGYELVGSPLKQDENGVWRMDFEDMDAKIKAGKIHTAIMCSPHNPCGRVWERWELEKAMEIFAANDVYVISDEIWSDLTLYGNQHIPLANLNDEARRRTVCLYAPSKTFSLAGLIGSYHIIPDPWLRDQVRAVSNLTGYNSCNVLSMHALIGAYNPDGEQWLKELRVVLGENVDFACDYIRDNFKGVSVFKPEGTYMLFLDCEGWCREHGKTMDELEQAGAAVGVMWQDGRAFGGDWTIRMNLALPIDVVKEAFDRLNRYVFNA